ncbi:MAG TPA: hypothetical protein VFW47_03850 [Phenylobacterium sp.]|nr:hypothetical protein [Phenylobacterium sp.]
MRLAPSALFAVAVLMAGSAAAADRATDIDFLRASRCRGLAAGLAADTTSIDAFLKTEMRTRDLFVVQRGEEEQARGKRDARRAERAAKASEELNGPCQAYKG